MVSRKTNSKSRSKILKKYELAYEKCIKKAMKTHPIISKRRPSSLKSKCVKKISKKISKSLDSKTKRLIKNTLIKKSRKTKRRKTKTKSRKSLNTYQKFIKKHVKDPKFKNMSPSSRMKAIAKLWKKKSRK